MNKLLIIFGLSFSTLCQLPCSAQSTNQQVLDEMSMARVSLISRDIKAVAGWYKKYLKFIVLEYKPEKQVKMRRDNFQLVIDKGKNTLLLQEITFTKGKKYVNGIDKIGFKTNQFDSLKMYLERYEQKFHREEFFDKNLDTRSMIVLDPEGNKIQLFDEPDESERFTMKPSFFSINSSDYLSTLNWYKANFGFKEIELEDDKNIHFQNFLTNGSITMELLHLPFESLETTEFMPVDRDLASYDQIMFRTGLAKKTVFQMDNTGNKIVLKQ